MAKHDEIEFNPRSDRKQIGNSNTQRWTCLQVEGLSDWNALASISLEDFLRFTTIANESQLREDGKYTGPERVAQREQRDAHARAFAEYFLGAVANRILKSPSTSEGVRTYAKHVLSCVKQQDFYSLPPVTLNMDTEKVETVRRRGSEGPTFTLAFSTGYRFGLADGGHRKKAAQYFQTLLEYVVLENELPKSGYLSPTAHKELSVRAPLDHHAEYTKQDAAEFWMQALNIYGEIEVGAFIQPIHGQIVMERQSYHDLNNLGLKLVQGQALSFDLASPINEYLSRSHKAPLPPLADQDVILWANDEGEIARKHAASICAYVIRGRSSQKGITHSQFEQKVNLLEAFWTCACSLPGVGKKNGRDISVASQPVVLKAIARLTWEVAFGIEKDYELAVEIHEKLYKLGKDGFFKHDRRYWLPYDDEDQIKDPRHVPFLPPPTGVNRNLGAKDSEGRIRYGAKHNDIVSILVDVLRCELGLDPKKNRGPAA